MRGLKKIQTVQTAAPLLLRAAGYTALPLFPTTTQFSAVTQLCAVALAHRACAHQASC